MKLQHHQVVHEENGYESSKKTVLLVDDEPWILAGLKRFLWADGYEILGASSGEEALNLLSSRHVDIIVADQLMPGICGLELLERVRNNYPKIPRLMLTGHPKHNIACQAISDGTVFRFFTKPCNTFELGLTIRQALQQKTLECEMEKFFQMINRLAADCCPALDSLGEGILRIDGSGSIHQVNRAIEALWGYSQTELTDKRLDQLMSPSYEQIFRECCRQDVRPATGREMGKWVEGVGFRKDGSTFSLEWRSSKDTSPGQEIFLVVVRDISERKTRELSLLQTKEIAERSNRAKSDFFSLLTHELRTPLHAILEYTRLIDTESLEGASDFQRENIQQMLQQILLIGDYMLKLINEGFELSSVETGQIPLDLKGVAVGQVVSETVKIIAPSAHTLGINLVDQTRSHHHTFLHADRIRLKQVLLNLLSNAIRYHEGASGSIWIRSELTREQTLRLSILDNVPGVSPSLSKSVNHFGVEQPEADRVGMGFLVAKRFIELMGGTIFVNNPSDRGHCFTVELPVVEPITF